MIIIFIFWYSLFLFINTFYLAKVHYIDQK